MAVVKSITVVNGRVTAVTGGTVDTVDVTNDAITFAKMQNIASNRLLGRHSSGSGDIEEITPGSGVSLAGGVLSFTGSGSGTVTEVGLSPPAGMTVSGSPVTDDGTLSLAWNLPAGNVTPYLLGRYTSGTASLDGIAVGSTLAITGGVLNVVGSGIAEDVQDIVGAMVSNTDTITWSYNDGAGTLSASVSTQKSVTVSDSSGIRLVGDEATPGSTKYYGTDGSGNKGWHSFGAVSGTVTSVGLSLPAIFSVSGSPVTTSGTLTGSLATQTANTLWAGPTTGAAAAPTFRALVSDDLSAGIITTAKIADGAVTTSKIEQIAAGGVIANSTTGTASPTVITGSTGNVLRCLGGTVGFGSVNLSSSAAVTGILPVANGGTGNSTAADGGILFGQSGGWAVLFLGASGKVLTSNGTGVEWSDPTIANGSVTTAKIADLNVATGKIADSAVTTAKIADGNVTLAKLASMTDSRLLGRSAGSAGTPGEITVGTGLSLSGGNLSCTVTGTVTSVGASAPALMQVSGSPVTTNGTIDLDWNLATSRLVGRTTAGSGDAEEISVASPLTLSSGSLGLGTVAESKGGTNQTTYTTGDLLYASASNTLSRRAIGTTGQVLSVASGVPTWRDEYAATNDTQYLSSSHSITATDSWQNTGLSITLPAAGTYLIHGNVRGLATVSGGTGQINCRLYDTTNGAVVTDSERMCVTIGSGTAQATAPITLVLTVSGSVTIRLEAQRTGSASTWTTSQIVTTSSGKTSLGYVRLY